MGKELVSNRKAHHNYQILETFEAGLVLLGSEIKSLRNHGGALQDAYVDIKSEPPRLLEASIAPYAKGGTGVFNHEERRARPLLLHKKEIATLRKKVQEKGLVIIPLSIYLNQKGFAKVKIALARGKKLHDKREALKEKSQKREMRRLQGS